MIKMRNADKDLETLDDLLSDEDDGGDLGEFACNHMGYWIETAKLFHSKLSAIDDKISKLKELDDISKSEGGYLAFSEYRYYLNEIHELIKSV